MLHRIEVATKKGFLDAEGAAVRSAVLSLGLGKVKDAQVVKVYKLEGIDDEKILNTIAEKLLCEKIWQEFALDKTVIDERDLKVVEIAFKPGVMDPEVESINQAVKDLGIDGLTASATGKKYIFRGDFEPSQVQAITDQLLMNKTIQSALNAPEKTLLINETATATKTIPIRGMTEQELLDLSAKGLWLNLDEMKIIQDYFKKLERDATDLEVEMLAQTWSEHCVHKTFKAKLVINGVEKPPLMKRIREATEKINSKKVISVFEDNSGVISFFDDWALCGKGETHNSPSAIEPYGGAMTGSGGVFRDIVGTGQGAKTIISTDIFCFAPLDTPKENVPEGSIHPRRLAQEVVRGVKDYGNRIGIPTNNGSLHFHPDFVAKPTVLVGAYGLIPKKYAKKGKPKKSDLILTVGGRTGRDGIHGATFSSGEMTATTKEVNSSAVQIGNAIEEKRTFDAILVARDHGLIRAITDCGAGGLSSAVGEIAEQLGANIRLNLVPLKYQGLSPWEIWLSESQERMVLAVDPMNFEKISKIFKDFNVEAQVIGEFSGNGKLKIVFNQETVCDMDMEFLHDGLPQRTMEGVWNEPELTEPELTEPENYPEIFQKVFAHWNVCSKEAIVRRYDHEVMGTSVLKPYSGVSKDAPNDAAIVEPILGSGKGLAVAHGLNPVYNKIHPYWGALCAFDECVRNLVASGVDPKDIALLDNFVWPFPEAAELGQLDQAVDACFDVTTAWKMPLVSGKDSLSSTYRGPAGKVIKIPPVLCVSGFAPVSDITKTISTDLKTSGNILYLIGETKAELGGSAYYDLSGQLGKSVPKVDIKKAREIFEALHKAMKKDIIRSAHDVSEGGLGITVAEMCFGGNLGATIDLSSVSDLQRADQILFSESQSRFVVEVSPDHEKKIQNIFKGLPIFKLGEITSEPELKIDFQKKVLIKTSLDDLRQAYKSTMSKYF